MRTSSGERGHKDFDDFKLVGTGSAFDFMVLAVSEKKLLNDRDGWLCREMGGCVGKWVAKLVGDGWLSWRKMGG